MASCGPGDESPTATTSNPSPFGDLCRPHTMQTRRGQLLRPVMERLEGAAKMRSIRLPAGLAAWVREEAWRSGLTSPAVIRRALERALANRSRLRPYGVATGLSLGADSERMGAIRLSPGMALDATGPAVEPGCPVAESIRRAVEAERVRRRRRLSSGAPT
jgi:hypothetical protein